MGLVDPVEIWQTSRISLASLGTELQTLCIDDASKAQNNYVRPFAISSSHALWNPHSVFIDETWYAQENSRDLTDKRNYSYNGNDATLHYTTLTLLYITLH